MIGRLRLWSAYVLFAYVTTHLLNHALGLISLRVHRGRPRLVRLRLAEPAGPGRALRRAADPFRPGAVGDLAPPLAPALALGMDAARARRRRSSRSPRCMSSPRAWRTTTTACESGYPWVLASLVAGGWIGIARQFALPFVVWIHACIGLHFAWRLRPWYRDLAAGALCRRPAGAGRRRSPAPAIALRDFAELAQQPGFLREVFAQRQRARRRRAPPSST